MQAIVKTIGPPKKPVSAPTIEDMKGSFCLFVFLNRLLPMTYLTICFFSKDVTTPCSNNSEYSLPTLEDLGHDTAELREELFPGGEQEALRRLDEHMKRKVLPHKTHLDCSTMWVINQIQKAPRKPLLEQLHQRRFVCFLSSGVGVQVREAADVPQLLKSQHHRPQPLRHFWLPVCTPVLVEADGSLSGGACPRCLHEFGLCSEKSAELGLSSRHS